MLNHHHIVIIIIIIITEYTEQMWDLLRQLHDGNLEKKNKWYEGSL